MKLIKLVILNLILAAFLSACGNSDSEGQADLGPILTEMQGCYRSNIVTRDPFMQKVITLANNVNVIREQYRKAYASDQYYNLDNADPLFPRGMNLSAKGALKISLKILNRFHVDIDKEIESYKNAMMYDWFFAGKRPNFKGQDDESEPGVFLNAVDRYRLRKYVRKTDGLINMAERWRHAQCQRDQLMAKRFFDIRDFLELDRATCPGGRLDVPGFSTSGNGVCLETLTSNWDILEQRGYRKHKKKVKRLIHSLCVSAGYSPSVCTTEFEKYAKENKIDVFYKSISLRVKKSKTDSFFKISKYGPKFKCEGTWTKVMKIPVYLEHLARDYKPLMRRIAHEFYKSSQNFRVEFDFVKEYDPRTTVIVKFEEGAVSHVKKDKPLEIIIAKKYENSLTSLKVLLAHEIGHVLGLPDCYVEFFNSDATELVYYYIEPRNLMCSLSNWSSITSDAFKQIKQHKCR